MNISEILSESLNIPEQDKKDALQVFKDWCFQFRARVDYPEQVFSDAYDQGQLEEVLVNQIVTHHDWGRRPKSNTPPIIMRLKNGKLIVLDGQHRVLHAREKGEPTISAFVINIPLNKSKLKGYYLV